MLKRSLLVLSFALLFQAVAFAGQKNDVEVTLVQHKVVKKEDGKEILTSADKIKPGDVIEYRASYLNTTQHAISKLAATLPVPAETEYVSGSAHPANVKASTDGVEFQAIPLKRKVKLSDGKEVERVVPAMEYKALRWDVGDLKAGKSVTVTARVKVQTVQVAPLGDGGKTMR